MVEVKINKIRSYQTLVYKNGNRSFPKKEYDDYKKEIRYQLVGLPRIKDLRELEISIHFKCKNKTVGDLDNITKPILDILQLNGNIKNDKQITKLHLQKSFKHKDNSIVIEIKEV